MSRFSSRQSQAINLAQQSSEMSVDLDQTQGQKAKVAQLLSESADANEDVKDDM